MPDCCKECATSISLDLLRVDPRRVITHTQGGCGDEVREALRIFVAQLAAQCAAGDGACADPTAAQLNVSVVVTSSDPSITWETDESYQLSVDSGAAGEDAWAAVTATTWLGARHGLETLLQLTVLDGAGALRISGRAQVTDAPAFPHRGLLLDTGRNFLPLDDIRRQVDALAACKMNVLHWHATDSHSFPLLLDGRLRQLAVHGAYSAAEVYSAQDVAELVLYARARGVRVLLEIDAPAHAGQGWQWGEGAGLGSLALCIAQQPWRASCIQPPCGQLDPTNPHVYELLGEIFAALLPLFPPGAPLHLGGDEVFIPCWNASAHLVAAMRAQGLKPDTAGFFRLWADFHARVLRDVDKIIGNENTPVIIWSSHLTEPDVIDNYFNKSRHVVQTWLPAGDKLPEKLLALGYRVLVSTKDAWYLDHGWWGDTRYASWRRAYDNPVPRGALGGEAAMWGELVDGNSIDAKVWPRTAAVAERLWSDPREPSGRAEARFFAQRDRLLKLAVRAESVAPGWCVQNQGACV